MKKRYAGLVDAIHIVAVFLIAFGGLAGFLAVVSKSGNVNNGLSILLAVIVGSLVLFAIAAIIDLLASMEVRIYQITEPQLRGNAEASTAPKGSHPLSRAPGGRTTPR